MGLQIEGRTTERRHERLEDCGFITSDRSDYVLLSGPVLPDVVVVQWCIFIPFFQFVISYHFLSFAVLALSWSFVGFPMGGGGV